MAGVLLILLAILLPVAVNFFVRQAAEQKLVKFDSESPEFWRPYAGDNILLASSSGDTKGYAVFAATAAGVVQIEGPCVIKFGNGDIFQVKASWAEPLATTFASNIIRSPILVGISIVFLMSGISLVLMSRNDRKGMRPE